MAAVAVIITFYVKALLAFHGHFGLCWFATPARRAKKTRQDNEPAFHTITAYDVIAIKNGLLVVGFTVVGGIMLWHTITVVLRQQVTWLTSLIEPVSR